MTSSDVEVIILETGEVQGLSWRMTIPLLEILKTDSRTGKHWITKIRLCWHFKGSAQRTGELDMMRQGNIRYNPEELFYRWTTDDGSEVRKTAHPVITEGGHSYIDYDYDSKPVPGSVQAVCYVTETGAMHFDYMPVGKYVLVEEGVPSGMKSAAPLYIPVLDVGSGIRTQSFLW